jgi:hypothetical protein
MFDSDAYTYYLNGILELYLRGFGPPFSASANV